MVTYYEEIRADSTQGLLATFVFSFTVKDNKDLTQRIIILPLVWYGFGTWSLTLEEEGSIKILKGTNKRTWIYKCNCIT